MRSEVHMPPSLEEEEEDDDDEAAEYDDHQTKVLCQLCSMISHILQSPPLPISLPGLLGPSLSSPASPAAFASLLLGVSLALMLFGSLTFAIGFFLVPLLIALLFLFYFVAMLHNLSELGRTILWPPYPSTADVPPPPPPGLFIFSFSIYSLHCVQ